MGINSSDASILKAPSAVILRGSEPSEAFSGVRSPQPSPLVVPILPGQAGTAKLTIAPPPGWDVSNPDYTIEVRPSGLQFFSQPAFAGKDSVRQLRFQTIGFGSTNQSGLFVRITSSDPSRLLVSPNVTDLGTASITMLANRGFAYIHSLMDSGSAAITVTFESAQGAPVAGTQNNTMNFKLVPSMWRFSSTETLLGRGASALNFGLYDVTGETGAQEAKSLRPGARATVGFNTSDPSIGSVQPNPIVVVGPLVPVLSLRRSSRSNYDHCPTGSRLPTLRPIPLCKYYK